MISKLISQNLIRDSSLASGGSLASSDYEREQIARN